MGNSKGDEKLLQQNAILCATNWNSQLFYLLLKGVVDGGKSDVITQHDKFPSLLTVGTTAHGKHVLHGER